MWAAAPSRLGGNRSELRLEAAEIAREQRQQHSDFCLKGVRHSHQPRGLRGLNLGSECTDPPSSIVTAVTSAEVRKHNLQVAQDFFVRVSAPVVVQDLQ